MTIKTGDSLPDATLARIGVDGPESVQLFDLIGDAKAVIFGVPGAYTPTCHSAHVPSFMRAMPALREKGVAQVVCVSANDPFVMKAWSEATGAADAGIAMLGDPEGAFAKATGLEFSAPAAGLLGRFRRFSMLVESGTVAAVHEDEPGVCDLSSGERMLEAL